ncbi:hypothetical protein [uncultured Megamonas sp.]|uniref:hypothetical protein n=1 Tax=uncultured Megamonas sp. TaxID=286140 RepID=UPI00259AF8AF|nr:hypothetical protein [uncultured Megamonas sp.]
MSKYTTEVRFICESKSGLENSSGADNVDEVIAGAWNKIFTSKAPFFDESYRSVLCQKILKHYYLREICCETVGIWKLWMNERLETIMPYYNQLYESELIKFEPLNDVNLTRKHDRTVDGTEERNGETSDTANGTREITYNGTKNTTNNGTREVTGTNDTKETVTSDTTTSTESNETKRDLYSDTPQGAITGLENENYLTNARKITDNVTSSGSEDTGTTRNIDNDYTENDTTNNTENTTTNNTENMTTNDTKTGTNKVTGTSNTTEDYLETLIGKQGSGTYSKMLMEFRDTFLNIDMMVIDEFKDLFFGLW